MGAKIEFETTGLLKANPQNIWTAVAHPDTVAKSITSWDPSQPNYPPCEPRKEDSKTILRYFQPATPGTTDSPGLSETTIAEIWLVNQQPNSIQWDVNAKWYHYRLTIQVQPHQEGLILQAATTGRWKRSPFIVRFMNWIKPVDFSKKYLINAAKVSEAEFQALS